MTIEYRIADQKDNELIYEFALKAINDSILPKFAEDAGFNLQERLSSGSSIVIIALDGEDIVGYAEIDTVSPEESSSVFVRGLYVLPSHRREGVGGTIIKMIKDKFAVNKKVRVRAYTGEGKNFWESLGFIIHHHDMVLKTE